MVRLIFLLCLVSFSVLGQNYVGVTIGNTASSGTKKYLWSIQSDTLELNSTGITSPAIKLTDYAGTGGRLAAFDENGTLIRTALDSTGGSFGDVFKVGTPVDNQIGIWTGDGTIEGVPGLTFANKGLTIDAESTTTLAYMIVQNNNASTDYVLTGANAEQFGVSDASGIFGLNRNSTTKPALFLAGRVGSSQDSGTSPIVWLGSTRDNGSAGITTRPILGIYNGSTKEAEVSAAGDWNFQSNNFTGLGTINTHTIPGGTGTFALTSNLASYVPYTGATTNVNLGSQTLTTTGSITGGAGSFTTVTTGGTANNISVTTNRTGSGQHIQMARNGVNIGGMGATSIDVNFYHNLAAGSFVFNPDLNDIDYTFRGSGSSILTMDGGTKAAIFSGTVSGAFNGTLGATTPNTVTATQTNTDNTRLDGNTLSITETNGNLNLASNGTGDVLVNTNDLVVDASANRVGLQTAAPASSLHVADNSAVTDATNGITVEQAGAGDASMNFYLTGGQRFSAGIDNSASLNNFGIIAGDAVNTVSGYGISLRPDGLIQFQGDAAGQIATFFNDGNNANRAGIRIVAGTDAGTASNIIDFRDGDESTIGAFNYVSGNLEYAPIGELEINGNTADRLLRVFNDGNNENRQGIEIQVGEDSGDGLLLNFLDGDGTAVGSVTFLGTTTLYNTTSDYRLKDDFKTFDGLSLVRKMKIYDYKWREHKSRSYGVKAHELQEILPYAVTGEKDGDEMQGVDYSKIVPILVKAIQEQQEQIDALTKRVSELEK